MIAIQAVKSVHHMPRSEYNWLKEKSIGGFKNN